MLAPIWYSDRIQAAPMENGFGSNLSISWRTHSCVPRRDSSRRLFGSDDDSRASVETSLDAARRSACATSYLLNFVLGFAIIAPVVLAADPAEASKYTGPGSCSSPACHGGVQAREETSVLQNEYSTWVVRDKHAHAYTVLTNPVGTRMAKILGLQKPDTAPKCLACHALDVPAEQRAKTFDLTDGVGCENCHGPASAWLGPHTTRDWKYEKSLELGMFNTRNLIKRSEKCLSCHLGTPEKFVDHEMIAAGHPDLYFEMDSFMAVMPAHWKEVDKDPWVGVRTLGIGQAVQLREQLKRVAREVQGGIWPEYAELDCFACHHNLTDAKVSWRQERGYPGRRPGNPPWRSIPSSSRMRRTRAWRTSNKSATPSRFCSSNCRTPRHTMPFSSPSTC